MKRTLLLLSLLAALPAYAAPGVTASQFDPRSPLRDEVMTYAFSATADSTANVIGICPAGGANLIDIVYGQAAAGVGGVQWTAGVKKNGTLVTTTPGGFTLAAGANKATNVANRTLGLTLPTGGTRPVFDPAQRTCTGGDVFSVDLDVEHVHATGTATIGASLAADEKVTFRGHDFVVKAQYASNVITASSVAAGDTVTLDGVVFLGTTAGATPGPFEFAVGEGGSANADSATNLADAINLTTVASRVTALAATDTVTLTAVSPGATGNGIPIATSSAPHLAITTEGGLLAGAYDSTADEWPLLATTATQAAALANALNMSTTSGVVGLITATSNLGVVTVRSVLDGTGGNAYTWTKTGDNLTVSGSGTLTGATNYTTAVTGSVQLYLEPKY